MIDYLCVSADMNGRVTEYSDHLHEHVVHPVTMKHGRYMPPADAGYSVEFTTDAISQFTFTG